MNFASAAPQIEADFFDEKGVAETIQSLSILSTSLQAVCMY